MRDDADKRDFYSNFTNILLVLVNKQNKIATVLTYKQYKIGTVST